jgi:uncharacterized paraquat-inducible protein A
LAYLNCPSCRLTVYSGPFDSPREHCPRCQAKLGKVSRLFKSAVPQRLAERQAVSAGADELAPRLG